MNATLDLRSLSAAFWITPDLKRRDSHLRISRSGAYMSGPCRVSHQHRGAAGAEREVERMITTNRCGMPYWQS
jgi:hypothetical protein